MQIDSILPLLVEAGEEVLKIYHSSFEISWKKENDPVTHADLVVNKILTEGLRQLTPDIPLLSEETTDDLTRLKSSKLWILDPIDGTREFIKKNPEFAISLGLVENGIAKYGFILNPASKELIFGGKDLGIFYKKDFSSDLNPIQITLQKKVSQKPVLLLSPTEVKDGLFENEFWKKNFSIQIIGSIAYKLGLLACGFGDLVVSARPKSEWDVCGGIALVLSSGQTCFTLLEFKEYRFNEEDTVKKGLIAGKKELVENLITQEKKFLQTSFRERTEH